MNKIWIIIAMILLLTPIALAFSGSSTNYKLYYGIDGMGLAQGISTNYKIRSNLLYQPIGKYNSANYKLYLGPYYIKLTSAPNITILSPTNNSSYYKVNVLLNFTISNNASPITWIKYSLNGTANKTITGPINLTGLSGKWNNIIVYANDTNGVMVASNATYFFYCFADIDGDTRVTMGDVTYVLDRFGKTCKKPGWDPSADLDDNCQIDMGDVTMVLDRFGKTCK